MELTEENIENFIKDNREKFDDYVINLNHESHFLKKLYARFKLYISIVPYLIRIVIFTFLIFSVSFLIWCNFICPPLTCVSLKYSKYEFVYKYEIYKTKKTLFNNEIFKNSEKYQETKMILSGYNIQYKSIKKDLKKNKRDNDILNMLQFYKDKLIFLKQTLNQYSI